MLPAAWFVLGAVLAAAEVLTLTLFLGLVAVAAVVTGVVALTGVGVGGQLLVFAGANLVGLAAVKPLRARMLPVKREHRTGVDALVGSPAVVLEPVHRHGEGRVRLAGEVWSARAMEGVDELPAGTPVQVVAIDGATAVVFPAAELGA